MDDFHSNFIYPNLFRVGGWTNPFEKYDIVKLDHFPRDRGDFFQIETTTQFTIGDTLPETNSSHLKMVLF